MRNKELKFGSDAQDKMIAGMNILAKAVSCTLGPKGKLVVIDGYEKPKVTKDGVSVAKEIKLKDPFMNMGAQLIKEAALKTVESVGDSTTTSIVLAQALINEVVKDLGKESIREVIHDIQKAKDYIFAYIDEHTIPIQDSDIRNIATISANNDTEIGNLIADAFNKVGRDGIVKVENSKTIHTTSNVINGMQFERGYVAQHFVTDTVKDECVLDNPYILITDEKVNSMNQLKFLLNQFANSGKSLLLIAEDYDDEVVETLKVNALQGVLKICPIKCPSFGDYRIGILQDLGVLTNGTPILYNTGMELKDVSLNMLGRADKVIVNKTTTTIIGGKGSKENIDKRVEELKAELERVKESPELDGTFMIGFLKERIAKLVSGICVIYAGGSTELEIGERHDRIEDAIEATKAAIESGVILGGGLTFYNAVSEYENKEMPLGRAALFAAVCTPLSKLLSYYGYTIKDVKSKLSNKIGFNACTGEFVDMYKEGIIDPAKGMKLALENAVSVAILFLSTDCVIVPEEINELITI